MENIPVEAVLNETSQQIQETDSFAREDQCHLEQVISTEETPLIEDQVQTQVEDGVHILEHSPFNTSHNSYTIAYKLAVLDWYHENGENKTLTSKHFGVARKRIRDWSLMEDQLRSMPQTSRLRKRNPPGKNHGRRPPGSIDLDQAILSWYKKQRESGVVVYSRQLRAKALELSPQCGLPDTFKASTQWLQNWKKRHAADIKECSEVEDNVNSDEVGNTVTLASDFEEHLRQLEQVGADLAAGHDSFAIVTSTPEVLTTQLHVEHSVESRDITLTSDHIDTTGTLPTTIVSNGQPKNSSLVEKFKEQDQWLEVVEQTLESLETEVTKKLGQAKLILQQLRTGQECLRQQLQNTTSREPQSEPTTFTLGKRSTTSSPVHSNGQTKRPRNT